VRVVDQRALLCWVSDSIDLWRSFSSSCVERFQIVAESPSSSARLGFIPMIVRLRIACKCGTAFRWKTLNAAAAPDRSRIEL
jgi:hypothetical protein